MIKSMTGFGRGEYRDEKRGVVCEIKSVNHRYLDVSIKMPRRYSFCEDAVRGAVKEVIRRGKVEVGFQIESFTDDDVQVDFNESLAKKYQAGLNGMAQSLGRSGESVPIEYLASLPDVMSVVPHIEDEEAMTAAMVAAAKEALAAHAKMRGIEGEKLAADLTARGDEILAAVGEIEARGPEMAKEYVDRMRQRIHDLLDGQAEIPEERIALEAAMFADKSNITEEIVRLRSHIAQLGQILRSENPEGKKLDFLIQEMNREANTIGSKANDLAITSKMLDIKNEVEKIREQVQNIE
ncbi:MAG: YicC family protein [Clostridiales bacterium]|nr:YicC family protein [Clostridiales bacterium]